MGALLQLFKDLFLIITTGYIITLFFIDYRKALIWYLVFYAFISLLGLNRVIYNENVVIPLMLLIVLIVRPVRFSRPNFFYLILFIYMIVLTYVNGLSPTDSYSRGTYLFLILLIYSNHLFSNSDYALKIVFLLWLIILATGFNFLIYGQDLFSVADIDSGERNLVLDTGVKGSTASTKGADLNYFSSGQAIGAIITILFLIYRKALLLNISFPTFIMQFLRSKIFLASLYIILSLQIWFIFRGLSRGGILVFLAGIITLMFFMKKRKYFFYGGLLLFVVYLVMDNVGILDLLIERFEGDKTGGTSGRNLIWLGILRTTYDQGGVWQVIFGKGIDWPWWEYWMGNIFGKKSVASTHNQWLSIYLNVGIFGFLLFTIPLIKKLWQSYKNTNPINNIRITLFACFLAMSISLEPLVFARYLWFIIALAVSYTPNFHKSINESSKLRRLN